MDRFYARTLEHALAYFGSRVLYPARPAATGKESELTRAACEKLAQEAGGGGRAKFDSSVRRLGYALGSELYLSYLAGRTSRSALRRLFLGDLEKAGEARKTCLRVLQKLRFKAKSKNRNANPNCRPKIPERAGCGRSGIQLRAVRRSRKSQIIRHHC